MKTKQWFIDRIGEKIYRNRTTCDCCTCDEGFTNGIVIKDKTQAEYMHMLQFSYENIDYRDKKDKV